MEALPYILKTYLASLKSRNKIWRELVGIISYPRRKGKAQLAGTAVRRG
jgi:hypothetical protein